MLKKRLLATLAASLLVVPAIANHDVPSTYPVTYDGALVRDVPIAGSLGYTDPVDGYDFYCFAGTQGQTIRFEMEDVSNTLQSNMAVFGGVVTDGTLAGALGAELGGTSNSNPGAIQLSFTPTSSGVFTLVASTYTNQATASYTLIMREGGSTTSCSPRGPTEVPALSPATLGGLLLLIPALVAFGRRRRK